MIPRRDFITALKFASHAMGTKDVRYYLNSTLFRFGSDFLELVATDGHRIARVTLELPTDDRTPFGDFIVKAASVNELLKTCRVKKNDPDTDQIGFGFDNELSVFWGASFMRLECEGGKYPEVHRAYDTKPPEDGVHGLHTLNVSATYLADSAKAISLLTISGDAPAELNFYYHNRCMKLRAYVDRRFSSIRNDAMVAIMPMKMAPRAN